MALQTKIEFISQDRTGREIVLRDSTGLESQDSENGYGPTNGSPDDILAHYFSISRVSDGRSEVLKVDGSNDLLPNNIELANGADLLVTDSLFGDGTYNCVDMFCDGVLDINMYVAFSGISGLNIEEGSNVIDGGSVGFFTSILESDAISVNDVIYQIDKSEDSEDGQLLWIVGSFEEDADTLDKLYRSNTKALLTSVSENLHSYACKKLKGNIDSPEWHTINTAMSFRFAAYGFFTADVPDYYEANDLVVSGYRLLKRYAI